MRKFILILSLLLITALAVTGCQDAVTQDDMVIELAPIHDVQISIAESYPEQIFVHIEGGLADSCTELHDIVVEPDDTTINITVTTERPRDAVCAEVYRIFEESVNLGSDFDSGVTYSVDVNGYLASFVYP